MKKLLLTVLLGLCTLSAGLSQVTIAPTNLFVEDNSRFGTYMVINNSNENQEISVDFVFSYSALNDDGQRRIVEDDSISAEKHSIAENVRAFPQNFVLNPGQRQIVRLRIAAPNDLEDGTYWARIKTSATPEAPPVEIEQTETVTASLGLIVEQITGLYYKVGTVNTGIAINEITPRLSDDGVLEVFTDFERTGNSPFLGSVITSLINSQGNVIQQARNSTTLYFSGTHKQDLLIGDTPPGEYTLRVEFITQRNDVSDDDIVQMQPVSSTTKYTLR
ncbi:MAG: hypothetical protein JJ953_08310 [Gracilimonas sp.]|uniref:hypothetical protein n=1 Tax=Gracilimonas TaxID=649462 RepID=UPI001B18174C|nr:hypothetical protein [Gracilimonas sp.]MBO6586090.1 hypothetical protein [Gracilimonas sp.]MBO6614747.1 hypothetical protein [Gracilimonas sp.]